MVTVSLTKEQWGVITQMMNGLPGMENAKVLLPIYEAIQAALQPPSAEIEFKDAE